MFAYLLNNHMEERKLGRTYIIKIKSGEVEKLADLCREHGIHLTYEDFDQFDLSHILWKVGPEGFDYCPTFLLFDHEIDFNSLEEFKEFLEK